MHPVIVGERVGAGVEGSVGNLVGEAMVVLGVGSWGFGWWIHMRRCGMFCCEQGSGWHH